MMFPPATRRRSFVLAAVFILSATFAASQQPRIVALGDIHGYAPGLEEILRKTGVIDTENHWAGGDTVLVQVGDLLDRGPEVRRVLDLMMRLQHEAPLAGGKVVVLLGNHEIVNLIGERKYIITDTYTEFIDDRSEKRRKQGWKDFKRHVRRRSAALGRMAPALNKDLKHRWFEQHPPGLLEYHESLTPKGSYGAWIRNLPTAVRIGDVLFVHGGLSPQMVGTHEDVFNVSVSNEIKTFDQLKAQMVDDHMILPSASLGDILAVIEVERKVIESNRLPERDLRQMELRLESLQPLVDCNEWSILSKQGPMWFRGASTSPEEEDGAEVLAALDAIGIRSMVVGHTPVDLGRIETRFDGRVFVIDTRMYSTPKGKGQPSALEINNGSATAVYLDSTEELTQTEKAAE